VKFVTSFFDQDLDSKPPAEQKLFWVIIISIVVITLLQYQSDSSSKLHELYRELYYFPIFIAALRFGTRGALICLAVIMGFYVPYIFITWGSGWEEQAARIIELFFYLFFALGAGYFADREQQIKKELDRTKFITSLGRITSSIVHDLKNPLIAIIGLLERLSKGKGSCERYVPVLLEDARKMERIVYDVLDFARPVQLKLQPANLSKIVMAALETFREKAENKGIKFKTALDNAFTLPVDSFLLERALVNIISNAIEASPEHSVISVMLYRRDGMINITVRDHGQGMNKETLQHCFEPYFSTKQGGTGLGLPIVKKIIEAHGGFIDIELPPSGGTMFRITLRD
jgi:signal transduction histidine kinase